METGISHSPDEFFRVEIIDTDLDVQNAIDWAKHESCGALSIFLGTTRDHNRSTTSNNSKKKVTSLYYEAYKQMAIKQIKVHITSILTNPEFKDHLYKVVVLHRCGLVEVKQNCIVIVCSGYSSQLAFRACEILLKLIKQTVPIWKKEIYDDNTYEWKQNNSVHTVKEADII